MVIVRFLDVRATYLELRAELDAAYQEVMDSGWFVQGKQVREFEREFADSCGATDCVGVGNGLDALHLSLRALDIGLGDEVIVPSNTFIATWLAVTYAGATPVPAEPDPETHLIDPQQVEHCISPRTRAIMPVHLFGQLADMTTLRQIADAHGLALVEDAAQAHGAMLNGVQPGHLGDVAAFSFYPGKNLGAYGDGGAVVTRNRQLADKVRLLANYGTRAKYDHVAKGVNSRLDEIQAAFLRVRLRHLQDWNNRRALIATRYMQRLASQPGLSLPRSIPGACPVWHLFVIRHHRRDELQAFLRARGIETLIHYPTPPHLSPAYGDAGFRRGDLPIAEELAETSLSLPIGPHLDVSLADYVSDAVAEFCGS